MAKYLYPAVFTKEDAGYSVNFPDLPNCFTSGATLEEAMDMANDVLCLTLYDLEQDSAAIPTASAVNDVPHGENEFVSCDWAIPHCVIRAFSVYGASSLF